MGFSGSVISYSCFVSQQELHYGELDSMKTNAMISELPTPNSSTLKDSAHGVEPRGLDQPESMAPLKLPSVRSALMENSGHPLLKYCLTDCLVESSRQIIAPTPDKPYDPESQTSRGREELKEVKASAPTTTTYSSYSTGTTEGYDTDVINTEDDWD